MFLHHRRPPRRVRMPHWIGSQEALAQVCPCVVAGYSVSLVRHETFKESPRALARRCERRFKQQVREGVLA